MMVRGTCVRCFLWLINAYQDLAFDRARTLETWANAELILCQKSIFSQKWFLIEEVWKRKKSDVIKQKRAEVDLQGSPRRTLRPGLCSLPTKGLPACHEEDLGAASPTLGSLHLSSWQRPQGRYSSSNMWRGQSAALLLDIDFARVRVPKPRSGIHFRFEVDRHQHDAIYCWRDFRGLQVARVCPTLLEPHQGLPQPWD